MWVKARSTKPSVQGEGQAKQICIRPNLQVIKGKATERYKDLITDHDLRLPMVGDPEAGEDAIKQPSTRVPALDLHFPNILSPRSSKANSNI